METKVWFEGKWHNDNPAIIRANDQASWLAGSVFDGARAIGGYVPDIDLHTERLILSAESSGLLSPIQYQEWLDLVAEGVSKFKKETTLYIRLMVWARDGFFIPEPDACGAALVLQAVPLPSFDAGVKAIVTTFLRPEPEMAQTNAKASSLYPNSVRAMTEAKHRGFDTAIFCDQAGNIAEMATSNICLVKHGIVYTPRPTGRFLNGITRRRVSTLLAKNGITTVLKDLSQADIFDADEIFTAGNYGKVSPITQVETQHFEIGPITRQAYNLYMKYACSGTPEPLDSA